MSGCSLIEANVDGCMATVHYRKTVKGRKDHKCGECRSIIKKGETHEHVKGLWEGKWTEHRTCAGCVSLRDETMFSYVYTCVFEDIFNQAFDTGGIDEDCMAKMTPEGREKAQIILDRLWEDMEENEDE